jgi:hypothetical protein
MKPDSNGEGGAFIMVGWSEEYTVEARALRAARRAGVAESMVEMVTRASMKFYRFPLPTPAAALPNIADAERHASNLVVVAEMLRRPGGASGAEIVELTGWQQHSMRGAISCKVSKLLTEGEVIAHWRGRNASGYAIINRPQPA